MGSAAANDRQEGGSHYKLEYQHWDFACDLGMPYLVGCATKYMTRWRKKNGAEDLRKAMHYCEKAMERGIRQGPYSMHLVRKFTDQLNPADGDIIKIIISGDYPVAIGAIEMIAIAYETRE